MLTNAKGMPQEFMPKQRIHLQKQNINKLPNTSELSNGKVIQKV